jgi:hypothetical protein
VYATTLIVYAGIEAHSKECGGTHHKRLIV